MEWAQRYFCCDFGEICIDKTALESPWGDGSRKAGSDAAIEFLKQHEGVWGKWVSSGAKKKIKAGL